MRASRLLAAAAPIAVATLLVLSVLSGCGGGTRLGGELTIVSGSENETLEPLLERFEREHGTRIHMVYKGSVDIMRELQQEEFPYDAVWPANGLWISMGDQKRRIKHTRSIMTSPVVFGIRESKAAALGFVGKEVRVADILQAIRDGDLTFAMTSATQSNSGASAYMGFLYALLGNPDVITSESLDDAELQANLRELLSGVSRSSGSSGWLKSLFLESDYDAMVNYEALIIEANQELVAEGREPLRIVYPVDGIVIADSPLGFFSERDEKKEEIFLALQEYLLSDDIQEEISGLGRRTGLGGILGEVDRRVFNPEWGVNTERVLSPFRIPSGDVIRKALALYQSELRKPSLTVYCLDFSGSMDGDGERQLEQAMALILDQQQASEYMLQAGSRDVTIVVAFSDQIIGTAEVAGNDPQQLAELLAAIRRLQPNGYTDIYSPVIHGLEMLSTRADLSAYVPAVILMTDGESNRGQSFAHLHKAYARYNLDVPVFAIMFGEALESQLEEITELTRARLFDGREDLVGTFRKVKGYN